MKEDSKARQTVFAKTLELGLEPMTTRFLGQQHVSYRLSCTYIHVQCTCTKAIQMYAACSLYLDWMSVCFSMLNVCFMYT